MGIFKKKTEKQEVDNTLEQNVNDSLSKEEVETQTEEATETKVDNTSKEDTDFVCYIKEMFDYKDGGCVVIGQVLVGRVNVKDQVLYVNQEGRVLGGCTIAFIDQAKNQLPVATAVGTPTYGTHYGFYLPEISKAEVVKGNLLVSSSMLEGDKIEKLNVEELVKAKMQQQGSPKLSLERKNEIGPIMMFAEIKKDDIKDLTIQEDLFLLCSVRAYNLKTPMENFEAKEKVLYDTIIEKIKASEKFYVTIDKTTNFPFINAGYVDIYSTEEFAKDAVDFYAQRYRQLEVREIEHCSLPNKLNYFIYLYFLGAENIMVDNGQYRSEVKRADILPPPDYSKTPNVQIPIFNPSLRFALVDFFEELRWRVNYPQRGEVLKKKEDHMIEEICKAKYLVPMKYEGEAERDGDKIRFKEDGKMMFAKITNTENTTFIPVFSDWFEFEKGYNKKEWNGAIVSILDAITIGGGDGIAINPYGENLILNENNMKQVREECERLGIKTSFKA